MGMTAAVAGASGYAGGELLRLLLGHPELEIGPLAAGSSAGRDVTEVHPHLPDLAGRAFVDTSALTEADADIVFLALPHGASAAVAATLPAGVRVIDLGADHRLVDAEAWRRAYGGEHAGTWTYGMPELPAAREAIRASDRVAAPGCYPTAVTLALAPLLAAGLVETEDIVVVAASGTSGAGRSPKVNLLGSEVMSDLTAYKVGNHQHRPEILQALGGLVDTPVSMSFTTVLAPMPRGILATCTARLRGEGAGKGTEKDTEVTTDALRGALLTAYVDEPFVRVLPPGRWPHTSATLGGNAVHLQVTADEQAGRAVVVAAIDNLCKGAAGQALQCANLMLGLPESTGLTAQGVAP
ncbi:N-acetyl-gamma-glutamyl-phosphate reductase [Protofrankia coriariae]|uniref:N-acetyl-gamma-glutamyl-phosphate reductase n=1 Tax=Protofrankia coriariae TaxID=1562887 RepID=A0ABR5F0J2_9ACTN|nr:N-acetyl-gamma-glutamyl-phosphate reductase [Protofrankia coriariae]KLL10224.1 N-acetyl-gamma-glutamyl-phosphate reductase [Protofrankia coriariae]